MPKTTCDLLNRAVAELPKAAALIAGDVTLNYANYSRAVDVFAARLLAGGADGGTVILLLRNSIAMAIATFAVHRAGAATAALNPDYTSRELAPMITDAAPAIIIVHAELIDHVAPLLPDDAKAIVIGQDRDFVDELLGAPEVRHLPAPPSPDALAVIQFTGGTTGRAKGVELTHRAVATNIAQREAVLPTVFGDESVLCMMPMFHSFAAAMCLHLTAYAGGTLIILPRYRPDWVIDAIGAHRVTRLPAGPTVFNGLLAFDGLEQDRVASLRCCYSGSAPLARETLARWEARTGAPIYEGYGQSEAGPVLTYQGPATGRVVGSVGPALPLTELAIVDAHDPDLRLPQGATGEIIARGPQIMRGYRGQPEATAATLRHGWLHTGDIGRLDADGVLYIEDRKKDMAIVGGFNVYPREIDEHLMAHPGVAAAAAVGVPDAYRGEVIEAFVVATPGAKLTEATLADHCATGLVKYKHPARIHLVEALPLTPVRKIDKVALRALALAGRVADVA
ncbi:AMP-binding protein [Sphingomonas sp. GlSt437]|uniref:AMP-binding protein n=1 Tax=Sphingomonas sp. GlSt437 TaxID=3389970 RepID=UPI003A86830D